MRTPPDTGQPGTGQPGTGQPGTGQPDGALCRVEALAATGAKGIEPPTAGLTQSVFVVKVGATIRGYINVCPHAGLPLEWQPDRFLTTDGRLILCGTHGAFFRPDDGYCVKGPCQGRSLQPLAISVTGDWVHLAGTDGRHRPVGDP